MNLWSMARAGGDLKQHTRHAGYDAQSPSLSDGRIVYQLGADIRVFDIAANQDRVVPIRLVSDFDQMRERWVKTPIDWVTAAAPLADRRPRRPHGARSAVRRARSSRGGSSRPRAIRSVRYRDGPLHARRQVAARACRTRSGEVEFWTRARQRHRRPSTQLTSDGEVLRWDGRALARRQAASRTTTRTSSSGCSTSRRRSRRRHRRLPATATSTTCAWSPDSKWLAYAAPGANHARRASSSASVADGRVDAGDLRSLRQLSARPGAATASGSTSSPTATSTRSCRSPWGSRQPEPFFDKQTQIYHVALVPGRALAVPAGRRAAPSREGRRRGRRTGEGRRTKDKEKAKDEGRQRTPSGRRTKDAPDRRRSTSTDLADAADRGAGAAGQLRAACRSTTSASISSRPRHRAADASGRSRRCAIDANKRRARDVPRGRPTATSCRADGKKVLVRQGRGLLRPRRRRQGAGGAATKAKVDSARGWTLPARPARRVAADVHRGLAPGARLLLRPRDARRRLDGDAREVRAAGRSRHRSRRAVRPARADGGRAVGAAHLRPRRRPARGRQTRSTPASLGARAGARRQGRRLPRRRTSTSPIPTCPSELSPLAPARRRRRRRATSSSTSTASPTLSCADLGRAAAQPGRQAGAAAA